LGEGSTPFTTNTALCMTLLEFSNKTPFDLRKLEELQPCGYQGERISAIIGLAVSTQYNVLRSVADWRINECTVGHDLCIIVSRYVDLTPV